MADGSDRWLTDPCGEPVSGRVIRDSAITESRIAAGTITTDHLGNVWWSHGSNVSCTVNGCTLCDPPVGATIEPMGNELANLVTAWVRTIVPFVASWLFVTFGIEPDVSGEFLTLLFGAIYYTVVRLVAVKVPVAGWLLGINKRPQYLDPPGA